MKQALRADEILKLYDEYDKELMKECARIGKSVHYTKEEIALITTGIASKRTAIALFTTRLLGAFEDGDK